MRRCGWVVTGSRGNANYSLLYNCTRTRRKFGVIGAGIFVSTGAGFLPRLVLCSASHCLQGEELYLHILICIRVFINVKLLFRIKVLLDAGRLDFETNAPDLIYPSRFQPIVISPNQKDRSYGTLSST